VACGQRQAAVSFESDGSILVAKGVRLGLVLVLTTPKVLSDTSSIITLIKLGSELNDTDFDSVWRSLVQDMGDQSDSPADSLEPYAREYFRRGNVWFNTRRDSNPETKIKFLRYISHFRKVVSLSGDRPLFVTEAGNYGVGPACAKTGDVAVILFGSNLCLVLRPILAGDYLLVGDAYVHGVMRGEVVRELEESDGKYHEETFRIC
jgi:hypothetical protein